HGDGFGCVHGGHVFAVSGGDAGVLQQEVAECMRKEIYSTKTGKNIAQKSFLMDEKSDEVFWERGLSCITREALLRRKIRLIRPLLGVKRQTLRAYLRLKGKSWIEDPTNEDRNFERVRVRQSLPSQKLTDIAQRVHEAALKRRQQARMVADLILALDIVVEQGRCFIAKPGAFLHRHPAFPFVVGLFAVLMGGGSYLLPTQKLRTLFQRICFLFPEKQRLTFVGSVIEYNRNGIALWRESRNMKEAMIASGKTFLWDRRYQIMNHESHAIKVGAASLEQLKLLLKNKTFQLERPHFPSLQSLLMLSSDKGSDIPELTHQTVFHHNVHIKRVMAPFDWLLLREDADFVNVVEPFFYFEVQR
ncbi:ATP-binding protein, partial [Bartonella rattaustraliani]|uniref:ATP-binding protein n=1 Tax=Bartonella rattaustraliani TaxID=481139 RepID=UPI00036F1BB0